MKQNKPAISSAKKAKILRLILSAAVIILLLIAYKHYFDNQGTNIPGSNSTAAETSFIVEPGGNSSPESQPQGSSSQGSQAQSDSSQGSLPSDSEQDESVLPTESSTAEQISEPDESSATESSATEQSAPIQSEPEQSAAEQTAPEPVSESEEPAVLEDDEYYTPEDVALYLHLYGHLPSNYITKEEAQDAGWVSSKGNLWKVTDHKVIGGNRFGNYEDKLPKAKGRKYYECDVNYYGGYRGEERLIYSSDGLIYYTDDHYNTFTLLYDKEGPK